MTTLQKHSRKNIYENPQPNAVFWPGLGWQTNPALTRHSYLTLCLVQAVRQQYTSIGAACSANMATHKLRRTNRVESTLMSLLAVLFY